MYITIHLPYRIEKEVGLAYNTVTNEPNEAFIRINLKARKTKDDFSEKDYRERHEQYRSTVAKMLECNVKYVIPISGEEYEENTESEEA